MFVCVFAEYDDRPTPRRNTNRRRPKENTFLTNDDRENRVCHFYMPTMMMTFNTIIYYYYYTSVCVPYVYTPPFVLYIYIT